MINNESRNNITEKKTDFFTNDNESTDKDFMDNNIRLGFNYFSEISKTIITSSSQDIFSNALLCNWDNIYGPRLQHIWTNYQENCSVETYQFCARQMLSSQILRDPLDSNIEKKFYIWHERKLALVAALFGAQSEAESTMHALIIFANFQHLNTFLFLKNFFLQNIFHIAQELKIFLSVNADKGFNSTACKLEDLLISTRSLVYSINYKLSKPFYPLPFTSSFLHNVLYNHLTQCCRTIVVGSLNIIDDINQMVQFLSVFTLDTQFLVKYATENSDIYSPNIHLQGLLKNNTNMEQIMCKVCYGSQPSALIDLDKKQCFILCPLKEYYTKMKSCIIKNLENIWNEKYVNEIYQNVFIKMTCTQSMLLTILNQIQLLIYDNNLCKNFCISFMMLLQKRALSLIKSFETALKCNHRKPISVLTLQRIEGLKLNSDFEIILSLTEIIKPGFTQLLYANSSDK